MYIYLRFNICPMDILLRIKHPILFHWMLKTFLKSMLHFRVVEQILDSFKFPTNAISSKKKLWCIFFFYYHQYVESWMRQLQPCGQNVDKHWDWLGLNEMFSWISSIAGLFCAARLIPVSILCPALARFHRCIPAGYTCTLSHSD